MRGKMNLPRCKKVLDICKVHLFDFAHQRITGVRTDTLIVKGLLGHSIPSVEEVLLIGAILADGRFDADPCLQLVDLRDQIRKLLTVIFALYAEIISSPAYFKQDSPPDLSFRIA